MLPVLFRDERFVVINKPPGLPVHAGPNGGASVEDIFPLLSRRRSGPWLVHRLDADTSGCLLIALRRDALRAAQAAFAAGTVRKTYWAIVRGGPELDQGVVRMPLRKQTSRAGWRMVANPTGQDAVTEWRILGRAEGVAWVEARSLTGRTHQVRVHCACLGCPVIGDPVYGGGPGKLGLLARELTVPLTPRVQATAPPPDHMRAALVSRGWGETFAIAGIRVRMPAESEPARAGQPRRPERGA